MRRVLGMPDKTFAAGLRKRLLEEFAAEHDQLEARLRLHAGEVKPSEAFRNRLRHQLTAKERTPRPIFVSKRKTWRRALEVGVSVMTVITLVTATVFFGSRPTTLATDQTLLTDFDGEVRILHNGADMTVVAPELPLAPGMTIATADDSAATIRFFEDSRLRLDENTTVIIRHLAPHSVRSDLGEVGISIVEGRIWVRNFATDEDYSRFVVALNPDNTVVMDSGGALDIAVSKSGRSIRVWERSAYLVSDGIRAFLSEGKEFLQRGNFNSGMLPIQAEAYQDAWIIDNFAADDVIISALLKEKMQAQRLQSENRVASLRERFVSPFGTNADDVVFDLESKFFDALAELSVNADATDPLDQFAAEVRRIAQNHHDETIALLASAEKTLSIVLPDSPLFVAKKTIEDLKFELEQKPAAVAAEERRTERLWEARRLAQSGNIPLAEEIIRENSKDVEAESEVAVEPADTADILAEKQEQLAALSALSSAAGMEGAVVESLEKETVEETSRIIRPGFPVASTRTTTDQVYDIITSIKKYESPIGQANTLRAHLSKIDNSAEQLTLLMEIKNRVPDELMSMVDEKIILILGEERDRAFASTQGEYIAHPAAPTDSDTPEASPLETPTEAPSPEPVLEVTPAPTSDETTTETEVSPATDISPSPLPIVSPSPVPSPEESELSVAESTDTPATSEAEPVQSTAAVSEYGSLLHSSPLSPLPSVDFGIPAETE